MYGCSECSNISHSVQHFDTSLYRCECNNRKAKATSSQIGELGLESADLNIIVSGCYVNVTCQGLIDAKNCV